VAVDEEDNSTLVLSVITVSDDSKDALREVLAVRSHEVLQREKEAEALGVDIEHLMGRVRKVWFVVVDGCGVYGSLAMKVSLLIFGNDVVLRECVFNGVHGVCVVGVWFRPQTCRPHICVHERAEMRECACLYVYGRAETRLMPPGWNSSDCLQLRATTRSVFESSASRKRWR
jgi:hypothetical protein